MNRYNTIVRDSVCNYLDADEQNASWWLNACTYGNQPVNDKPINNLSINNNKSLNDKLINDKLINDTSINDIIWGNKDIVEGFSNELPKDWYYDRIECPSSVEGEKVCPEGYSNINGECIQVCTHCKYTDSSGYFGNCIKGKENVKTKKSNTEISLEDVDGDGEEEIIISTIN